ANKDKDSDSDAAKDASDGIGLDATTSVRTTSLGADSTLIIVAASLLVLAVAAVAGIRLLRRRRLDGEEDEWGERG
ncbi:MAG: hypothetical protein LBP28_02325, partial [Coriobacteriales bacterium]|nr:hypothetical protein [Coriobacteriales bacterium]